MDSSSHPKNDGEQGADFRAKSHENDMVFKGLFLQEPGRCVQGLNGRWSIRQGLRQQEVANLKRNTPIFYRDGSVTMSETDKKLIYGYLMRIIS